MAPRTRRLSTASLASLNVLEKKKSRPSQDSQSGPRPIPQRQPLPSRAQSYAPSTAYSAQQASTAVPVPKKRKNLNLGSKIDAWWSAVTKSFTSPTEEGRAASASASKASTSRMPRPAQGRAASDTLAVNADTTEPVGRISAQFSRETLSLAPPPQAVRQVSSTSNLRSKAMSYPVPLPPPSGALAPAARTTRHSGDNLIVSQPPHSRLNSAGSEAEGSSAASSSTRSEFRRRNPQLSLRLDPRFQQATAHKLGEKRSNESSERSSSSGGPLSQSPAFFKEPRPPPKAHTAHHEQTPSLTPGQSPLWDRTPGLVPVSQMNAMQISRTSSRQAASPHPQMQSQSRQAQKTPQQTLAPTFSMSHIRDHIKHRLSGAKVSCDKELRKVITGITTYVEHELDSERAFDLRAESRQELADALEIDSMQQEEVLAGPAEAGGNDIEDEVDGKSGSQTRPPLFRNDTSSSGSVAPSSHHSRVSSPTAYPQAQQRRVTNPPVRGRSSGHSSPRRFSLQAKRGSPGTVRPADLAARLEKSLDLTGEDGPPLSQASSRSTSRSRSPMPNLNVGSASHRNASAEWSGCKNPQTAAEDDKRHFLHSLQAMVAIAQEIVDTSVKDLTDDPSTCAQLIKRVQSIGQQWDDHPHWPLRGWYVQLLLAVAGLSRVAEFWAEERGFWNFGQNDEDDNDVEPILFVAKAPTMAEEPSQSGSAGSRATSASRSASQIGTHESSLGIDIGVHRPEEETGDTSLKVSGPPVVDQSGAGRAEEAETLREAVEEVRNATILMELALDGESFQYISPVWEDVVGYVSYDFTYLLVLTANAGYRPTSALANLSRISCTRMMWLYSPKPPSSCRRTILIPSRRTSAYASLPRMRILTTTLESNSRQWKERACSCGIV